LNNLIKKISNYERTIFILFSILFVILFSENLILNVQHRVEIKVVPAGPSHGS